MKRKWLCALLLCLLPALARADAPDDAMRLVVYTAHKEEVYQPIVEEFERRTGVWVQVVSGGTTELLERIAAEAETPVADVMFGGGVELEERMTCPTDYLTHLRAGSLKLLGEQPIPDTAQRQI